MELYHGQALSNYLNITIFRIDNDTIHNVLESSATRFIMLAFFTGLNGMDRKYRHLKLMDRTLIGPY